MEEAENKKANPKAGMARCNKRKWEVRHPARNR